MQEEKANCRRAEILRRYYGYPRDNGASPGIALLYPSCSGHPEWHWGNLGGQGNKFRGVCGV